MAFRLQRHRSTPKTSPLQDAITLSYVNVYVKLLSIINFKEYMLTHEDNQTAKQCK